MQLFQETFIYPECDDDDQSDEDQFLLVNRRSAAPSVPPPNQSDQCSPINTNTSAPAKKGATRSPHDELVIFSFIV